MIRRAWRAFARGLLAEANGWHTGAEIVADEQARAQSPAPPPFASPSGGGAGPDPVPGTTVPTVPQAAESPPRKSPAPAPHGGIDYTIRVWKDGRIRLWDGRGRVVGRRECACPPPVDLSDEAIERWLNDAR